MKIDVNEALNQLAKAATVESGNMNSMSGTTGTMTRL